MMNAMHITHDNYHNDCLDVDHVDQLETLDGGHEAAGAHPGDALVRVHVVPVVVVVLQVLLLEVAARAVTVPAHVLGHGDGEHAAAARVDISPLLHLDPRHELVYLAVAEIVHYPSAVAVSDHEEVEEVGDHQGGGAGDALVVTHGHGPDDVGQRDGDDLAEAGGELTLGSLGEGVGGDVDPPLKVGGHVGPPWEG